MLFPVQDSGGGGAGGPLSQESAEMVKAALESGASVEQVGENVFFLASKCP